MQAFKYLFLVASLSLGACFQAVCSQYDVHRSQQLARAMYYAMQSGQVGHLERALSGGADLNSLELDLIEGVDVTYWRKTLKTTPLILSVSPHEDVKVNSGVVKLLLDKKADVNGKDARGRSALNYLCHITGTVYKTEALKILTLLLERGIDINNENSALEEAVVYSKSSEFVRLLLDYNPEAIDGALELARERLDLCLHHGGVGIGMEKVPTEIVDLLEKYEMQIIHQTAYVGKKASGNSLITIVAEYLVREAKKNQAVSTTVTQPLAPCVQKEDENKPKMNVDQDEEDDIILDLSCEKNK